MTIAEMTTAMTTEAIGTCDCKTSKTIRRRYSEATAMRVALIYGQLLDWDNVITISAIARHAGVSRATVRAILQCELGWTEVQSRAAQREGTRRGQALLAAAGHPGLARGRQTLAAQGWPNLRKGQATLAASSYAALQRGRATQAAQGWPQLRTQQERCAVKGYPQLAKGRANLAARGWPNLQRAQDALAAQGYLPVLDAQRRRRANAAAPAHLTYKWRMRGRSTRLAILEALQCRHLCHQTGCRCKCHQEGSESTAARGKAEVVTRRQLAKQLHLHPATVSRHLKWLRNAGLIDEHNCVC